MDVANNIWHIAPIPPNQIDHPCPFPEEIPHRLITLYSYPGELVLDPFAGSGQTLKVAHWLKRQFVGYETIKKYVDLARKRIDDHLSLRPQQLIAVFDKVGLNEPTGQKKAGNTIETTAHEIALQRPLLEPKSKYRTRRK